MFLSPNYFDHTQKVAEGINSNSWHVIEALDLVLAPKANEASCMGLIFLGACNWLPLWSVVGYCDGCACGYCFAVGSNTQVPNLSASWSHFFTASKTNKDP